MSHPMHSTSAARLWWGGAWRVTTFFAVWGLLLVPWLFALDIPSNPNVPARKALFEVCALASTVGVTVAMQRFLDKGSLAKAGLSMARAGPGSLLGLAIGAGWLGFTLGIVFLFGGVRLEPTEAPAVRALMLAVVGVTANAAMQELLVRGYIFAVIEARGGQWWALGTTSLLFALLHLGAARDAPLALANVALAGLLLGLLRCATGRLWASVGAHATWNLLLGPILGLSVSGRALDGGWHVLRLDCAPALCGGHFGIEGGLATTVVTALFVAAAAGWRLRQRQGFTTAASKAG
jgi:membrane protease YdiL (CAAX protease family)